MEKQRQVVLVSYWTATSCQKSFSILRTVLDVLPKDTVSSVHVLMMMVVESAGY